MASSLSGIKNVSTPISLSSYITGGCTPTAGGWTSTITRPSCSFTCHRQFEDESHVEKAWRSLTYTDVRTLKNYFCGFGNAANRELVSRLFHQPTRYLNQVVEKMGASNLGPFSVNNFIPGNPSFENFLNMAISNDNQIMMGQIFAFVLNGWSNALPVQEVLGVMSHEIAHRILQHKERSTALWLELNYIPVESLSDASEFLSAYKSKFVELPKKESAKRLCQNYINFENEPNPTVYSESESVLQGRNRKNEQEADLLTMRDPYLARGLRDFLVRVIKICEKNSKAKCSHFVVESQSHPSMVSRIQYMSRALCEEYPKENRDICSEVDLLRYRNNSTCPKVDLSHKWQW